MSGKSRQDHPICNKEEIARIINIKNNHDELLKLRAETIIDNIRFYRVYLKRYNSANRALWSLKSQFNEKPFHDFISLQKPKQRRICERIVSGFAFLQDPNGQCILTEFGPLIVISESLKYFLYYMNLFYLEFETTIPECDRMHALLIAMRTKLGTEALDFDLDPRGTPPKEVHDYINTCVQYQIQFVIGHEFGHVLQGHINKDRTVKRLNTDIFSTEKLRTEYECYSSSQKQEFEADLNSAKAVGQGSYEKDLIMKSAFLFFLYMDLYDFVHNFFSPQLGGAQTHPQPINRLWYLRDNINMRYGHSRTQLEEMVEKKMDIKTKFLSEFLAVNTELLETYGSAYLPSYREKVLIDRIDY